MTVLLFFVILSVFHLSALNGQVNPSCLQLYLSTAVFTVYKHVCPPLLSLSLFRPSHSISSINSTISLLLATPSPTLIPVTLLPRCNKTRAPTPMGGTNLSTGGRPLDTVPATVLKSTEGLSEVGGSGLMRQLDEYGTVDVYLKGWMWYTYCLTGWVWYTWRFTRCYGALYTFL